MNISAETKKFLAENNLINPVSKNQRALDYFVKFAPSSLILSIKALVSKGNTKRVLESQEFLLRANKSLSKGNFRQCKKYLRVAVALVGGVLTSRSRKFFYYEVLKAIRQPEEHLRISINLTNELRCLATKKKLSPETWYHLSKYFNFLGFTVAGFQSREFSILSWQQQDSDNLINSHNVELILSSYLEVMNIEKAQNLLKFHVQKISPQRVPHFQFYFNLISGADTNSFAKRLDSPTTVLRDLIYKKDVALIGPGVPSGEFGREIDSADVVIRVKFAGFNFLPPENLHGSRCDIASFNNLSSFSLLANDGLEIEMLRGLKAVLTCKRFLSTTIQGVPVVFIDSLRSAYPNGGLTAGITTLVNLVKLKPGRLKLFGFDFYTEEQVYDGKLSGFYEKESWIIGWPPHFGSTDPNYFINRVKGQFWEDQISNFALAKNFYKSGVFEIDEVGHKVLSMSREEYASKIEHILRQSLCGGAPLI